MNISINENQILNLIRRINEESEKESLKGKRVEVYYNLHKKTFSVTLNKKVVLHADYVKLTDVTFKVREGGKKKVRAEKQKNVHAFVIGNLKDFCQYPCKSIPDEPNQRIITYNPYEHESFVVKKTQEPIYKASEVEMINHRNKLFIIKEIRK